MTPARASALAITSAALLLGCGTATTAPSAPGAEAASATSSSGHAAPFAVWLHLAEPQPDGTLELMSSDGRVLRALPGGQLTSDGARLVTASSATGATRLRVLDSRTGAVVDDRALPPGYRLPLLGPSQRPVGLAPGDRFVALQDTPIGAEAGSVKTTHVAVVDLASGGAARFVSLQGDFEVDALSADGTQLYLIESLPPDAAGAVQYRVRRVDVPSGTLDPAVVVDKTDGGSAMVGVPVDRAPGGDPGWALTLYAFGAHGPFVHGLGLDAHIAVCVDLPPQAPQVQNSEEQLLWSLAPEPGKARLLAVNGGTGQVVELNSSGGAPTVARTADIPLSTPAQAGLITNVSAKRFVSNGAVVSPDGNTLYAVADQGIVAVDTSTLKAIRTIATSIKSTGLAMSPDGTQLLAVEEGGATVDVVDARSGAVTAIALHNGTIPVDALVGVASAV
jgi:hypothetical protein